MVIHNNYNNHKVNTLNLISSGLGLLNYYMHIYTHI